MSMLVVHVGHLIVAIHQDCGEDVTKVEVLDNNGPKDPLVILSADVGDDLNRPSQWSSCDSLAEYVLSAGELHGGFNPTYWELLPYSFSLLKLTWTGLCRPGL